MFALKKLSILYFFQYRYVIEIDKCCSKENVMYWIFTNDLLLTMHAYEHRCCFLCSVFCFAHSGTDRMSQSGWWWAYGSEEHFQTDTWWHKQASVCLLLMMLQETVSEPTGTQWYSNQTVVIHGKLERASWTSQLFYTCSSSRFSSKTLQFNTVNKNPIWSRWGDIFSCNESAR